MEEKKVAHKKLGFGMSAIIELLIEILKPFGRVRSIDDR